MQTSEVKQRIDDIEQCADEAQRALQQSASVPNDLRESVDQMHRQARQVQQACSTQSQQQANQAQLRQPVMQLEQAADRAMQACRQAGSVDPQLRSAIERAHQQASSLKRQMQMG